MSEDSVYMTNHSEGCDMTMTNDNDNWKSCNDMIGRILTYLDEDEVRRSTKKAVKSEIWDFYNNTVMTNDNEAIGNL